MGKRNLPERALFRTFGERESTEGVDCRREFETASLGGTDKFVFEFGGP